MTETALSPAAQRARLGGPGAVRVHVLGHAQPEQRQHRGVAERLGQDAAGPPAERDITSRATLDASDRLEGRLLAKEDGVVAGLLAQGLAPGEAAAIGVRCHGDAADGAAANGERGLLAGDVVQGLQGVVNP